MRRNRLPDELVQRGTARQEIEGVCCACPAGVTAPPATGDSAASDVVNAGTGNNLNLETEGDAPNNVWWIVLVAVLGGVLVLVPVPLRVLGAYRHGEYGPWAQKNRRTDVPILFAGNKWPSGIQGNPSRRAIAWGGADKVPQGVGGKSL